MLRPLVFRKALTMKIVELSFLILGMLSLSLSIELSLFTSFCVALIASLLIGVLAKYRHRREFARRSLKKGDRLISFQQSSGFRNYAPFPWWRLRNSYDARIRTATGSELEYWICAEGTLFGLFAIELWIELVK